MPRRLAALAAFFLALAASVASTASASQSLRVGIFDDGMVLYGEPERTFAQLANTGARLVRVNLWWSGPGVRVATRRPHRPTDPNDPAYNWDTYDRTVRFATVNGMQPVFSILGTPPSAWEGVDELYVETHPWADCGEGELALQLEPAGFVRRETAHAAVLRLARALTSAATPATSLSP